ncbi:Zn-ribbon domain-containing OB-fold protein [Labedaea rhizosphaerae]|uniref:OB-fold protein n=1 Tax=Labedaea rhizosphaerae TaxID=598644 RepID=A0A4R6SDK4_LABRH|nr:OB-fold domain-containing protein [Labedaea rhizosphaerae]TDP97764.1 hypothetical protein EV186_103730 [Labedaea rhizosphaerae]
MVLRDDRSAPFFDAARRAELVVRHCTGCGELAAPRVRACPTCSATALDWAPVSGAGTLVSWTVLRDRAGGVTAVGGIVELAEGPWLRVRLAADPETLEAGLAVAVAFEHQDDGEPVPVFVPRERAEEGVDGRR